MGAILRFLGLERDVEGEPEGRPETESVRAIAGALGTFPPERAHFLAAFAYLLSRAAAADRQVKASEIHAMERIVIRWGGLPPEQARLVVEIANAQSDALGSTEDFLVAREFAKIATREEKLALLDCLFEVAASDRLVSLVESNEIRQIASELNLDHRDFIAVRLRHRDHLAVLKKADGEGSPGSTS